ncbi:MAG: hypothetical protein HYT87_10385 [Nitrospirae bacterium]|nr:hypothetical protein [Nitrospirota bacterium]
MDKSISLSAGKTASRSILSIVCLVGLLLMALGAPACHRKVRKDRRLPEGFSTFSVEPTLAKAGDVLNVRVSVQLAAAKPPEVLVTDRPAELVAEPSEDSASIWTYEYSYTVAGDEPEGDAEVRVSFRDRQGGKHEAGDQVRFDFTPPSFQVTSLFPGRAERPCGIVKGSGGGEDRAASYAGDSYAEDKVATVQVVATETLTGPPSASIAGSPAYGPAIGGERFSLEAPVVVRPLSESFPGRLFSNESPVAVSVEGRDRAGNVGRADVQVIPTGAPRFCLHLTQPAEGVSLAGEITVAGTVEPKGSEDRVEVYLNREPLARARSAPFRESGRPGVSALGAAELLVAAVSGNGRWIYVLRRLELEAALPEVSALGPGPLSALRSLELGTGPVTPKGIVGSQGRVIRALAVDPQSGSVWIGTSGGLSRFDGGRFRGFGVDDGLGMTIIRGVAVGEDGRVAAAGHGGVAISFGGTWRSFGVKQGLPSEAAYSVAIAPDGSVWAGTAAGLARLEPEASRFEWVEELGDERVAALEVVPTKAKKGSPAFYVYAATGAGLFVVDPRALTATKVRGLPDAAMSALRHSPDGLLWLGSWGDGVLGVQLAEPDRAVPVEGLTSRDGLGSDQVVTLSIGPAEEAEGSEHKKLKSYSLWVGTTRGLGRWDGAELKSFTPADGLLDWSVNAVAFDPAGGRWFGTSRGLTRIGG